MCVIVNPWCQPDGTCMLLPPTKQKGGRSGGGGGKREWRRRRRGGEGIRRKGEKKMKGEGERGKETVATTRIQSCPSIMPIKNEPLT